jgi:plasmid stabilization system protein ParE
MFPGGRCEASSTHEDPGMPKSWSPKRERQYEHIKDSYEERGVTEGEAEERAARTVNKERAESGETKTRRKKG